MDAIRQRFLTDRVLTATPAQRVAMLYDRLALDLARARTDSGGPDSHLDHAARIVAELRGSLDVTAGGPADNLAAIYDFMLREIMTAQLTGVTSTITAVEANVWTLREAWVAIAAGTDEPVSGAPLARRVLDGLTGMTVNQEWEDVLAALEDDIRRTERAMREPVRVSDAVLGHRPAPSELQLPGEAAAALLATTAMPSMPPVETMPPVSPQHEARIRDLRTRIVALQLQLRDELAALRTAPVDPRLRLAAAITPAATPHFIDSRV